jgi:ribosomal protein S15P/S13E
MNKPPMPPELEIEIDCLENCMNELANYVQENPREYGAKLRLQRMRESYRELLRRAARFEAVQ